ncbi:MAG: hypothetical protein HY537_14840 [Deltaproteobacteria bacterium]|nr:hypothetical protein [Deltaproteobacteria bacterium]
MKTYTHDNLAPKGVYVAPRAMDVRYVGADEETIGGLAGHHYYRIPSPLLLLVAPLLGGAFVVLFPFLVFAFTAWIIAAVLIKWAQSIASALAVYARSDWEPNAAYFKKNPKSKDEDKKNKPEK